jgi:hypothetical protein
MNVRFVDVDKELFFTACRFFEQWTQPAQKRFALSSLRSTE